MITSDSYKMAEEKQKTSKLGGLEEKLKEDFGISQSVLSAIEKSVDYQKYAEILKNIYNNCKSIKN
jgi:fumarate hydratase class II